jgi:hypothetical protein
MTRQPDGMNFLDEWLREDHSAAAYYRAIQPAIPASLVSADNYARILEVASLVPGVCALGGFYFECVLGETEARADISFLVTPDQGGPGALAAGPPAGPRPRDNAWLAVQRLASRWNEPEEPLNKLIETIWLEFDINGTQPYSPSLFLTPIPHRGQVQQIAGFRSLFSTLSKELGEAIPPPSLAATLACLAHLPENAKLGQVGCMLSRQPAVVRLCLNIHREAVLEYLQNLKIPADLPRVAAILELFGSYDDEFLLHLDVLAAVQPKVGLDLILAPTKPSPEVRLRHILEELSRLKLCTHAKREALQELPGYLPMGANLINWPPALRRRALQEQFGEISYFIRTISHLKVVIEAGRDLVAKAYLSVNHHWKKSS